METTEMDKPARRRPRRRTERPSSEIAGQLARLAAERRAQDVLILDLRGLSGACDYFVLATGLSEPHLAGLADHLEDAFAADGIRPWHVEGRQNRKWILLDFVDVVVHLFQADTREYYRLENLWSEAPREKIRSIDPAPADSTGDGPMGDGSEEG
jgi:ribosome-associated protein